MSTQAKVAMSMRQVGWPVSALHHETPPKGVRLKLNRSLRESRRATASYVGPLLANEERPRSPSMRRGRHRPVRDDRRFGGTGGEHNDHEIRNRRNHIGAMQEAGIGDTSDDLREQRAADDRQAQ